MNLRFQKSLESDTKQIPKSKATLVSSLLDFEERKRRFSASRDRRLAGQDCNSLLEEKGSPLSLQSLTSDETKHARRRTRIAALISASVMAATVVLRGPRKHKTHTNLNANVDLCSRAKFVGPERTLGTNQYFCSSERAEGTERDNDVETKRSVSNKTNTLSRNPWKRACEAFHFMLIKVKDTAHFIHGTAVSCASTSERATGRRR